MQHVRVSFATSLPLISIKFPHPLDSITPSIAAPGNSCCLHIPILHIQRICDCNVAAPSCILKHLPSLVPHQFDLELSLWVALRPRWRTRVPPILPARHRCTSLPLFVALPPSCAANTPSIFASPTPLPGSRVGASLDASLENDGLFAFVQRAPSRTHGRHALRRFAPSGVPNTYSFSASSVPRGPRRCLSHGVCSKTMANQHFFVPMSGFDESHDADARHATAHAQLFIRLRAERHPTPNDLHIHPISRRDRLIHALQTKCRLCSSPSAHVSGDIKHASCAQNIHWWFICSFLLTITVWTRSHANHCLSLPTTT